MPFVKIYDCQLSLTLVWSELKPKNKLLHFCPEAGLDLWLYSWWYNEIDAIHSRCWSSDYIGCIDCSISFKVVKCERFLSETKNNKKEPKKEYAFDYLFHDGGEAS